MTAKAAATWEDLESLLAWVCNPKDNDRFIVPIAKSICLLGWGAPFVAWENAPEVTYVGGDHQPAGHRIAAGHLRQKAIRHVAAVGPSFLEQLEQETGRKPVVTLVERKARGGKGQGWTFRLPDAPKPGLVPVRFLTFPDEATYEAMVLRDNGEAGTFARDSLPAILARIADAGAYKLPDLGLGLSDADVDKLLAQGQADLARLSGVVNTALADAATAVAAATANASAPPAIAAAPPSGSGPTLRLPNTHATTHVAAVVVGKRRLPILPEDEARIEVLIERWVEKKGSLHGFAKRMTDAVAAALAAELGAS